MILLDHLAINYGHGLVVDEELNCKRVKGNIFDVYTVASCCQICWPHAMPHLCCILNYTEFGYFYARLLFHIVINSSNYPQARSAMQTCIL